jgi:hypothetical protein
MLALAGNIFWALASPPPPRAAEDLEVMHHSLQP